MKLFLLLVVCLIQAKKISKRSKSKSLDASDFAQLDQQEIQDHIQVNDELLDIINQQSNDYETKQEYDAESVEFDQLLQQMISEDDLIAEVEQKSQDSIQQQEPNKSPDEEINNNIQDIMNQDQIQENAQQLQEEQNIYDSLQSDQIIVNQDNIQNEILSLDQVESVVDSYLNNQIDSLKEEDPSPDQLIEQIIDEKKDSLVENQIQNQTENNDIINNPEINTPVEQVEEQIGVLLENDIMQEDYNQDNLTKEGDLTDNMISNSIKNDKNTLNEEEQNVQQEKIQQLEILEVPEIIEQTEVIEEAEMIVQPTIIEQPEIINEPETVEEPDFVQQRNQIDQQVIIEQTENNDQQFVSDQNEPPIVEQIEQSQDVDPNYEVLENEKNQQFVDETLNLQKQSQDLNSVEDYPETNTLIDPHQSEYDSINNLDQHTHDDLVNQAQNENEISDHHHQHNHHHHHHHHHHIHHDHPHPHDNQQNEQHIEKHHENKIDDVQPSCTFENKLNCMGEANEQLINPIETETKISYEQLTMGFQLPQIYGFPVAIQWGIMLNLVLLTLAIMKKLFSPNGQTYSIRQENQQTDQTIDTSLLKSKMELLNTQFTKMQKEHQLITQIINDLQTKVISVLEKKKLGQSSKSLNESDPQY